MDLSDPVMRTDADTGTLSDAWRSYYSMTRGHKAHATLTTALTRFVQDGVEPGAAVDLGCGDGRETLELLRQGWRVLAIDREPAALQILREQAPPAFSDRLTTRCANLEAATWPPALLVNAGLSLPFCQPQRFPALWRRIRASLLPGGRFSGHLLGQRDDWAHKAGFNHHNRAQIDTLLSGLHIELLQEDELDLELTSGQTKHWHIFHIVARQP